MAQTRCLPKKTNDGFLGLPNLNYRIRNIKPASQLQSPFHINTREATLQTYISVQRKLMKANHCMFLFARNQQEESQHQKTTHDAQKPPHSIVAWRAILMQEFTTQVPEADCGIRYQSDSFTAIYKQPKEQ